jgi:hypothetical protein
MKYVVDSVLWADNSSSSLGRNLTDSVARASMRTLLLLHLSLVSEIMGMAYGYAIAFDHATDTQGMTHMCALLR